MPRHAAGRLAIPDADAAGALYELTQEMTEAAGLPAYEISNHAAPGEESRQPALLALRRVRASGRARTGGSWSRATPRHRDGADAGGLGGTGWSRGATGSAKSPRSAETVDEALLMGLRLREGST